MVIVLVREPGLDDPGHEEDEEDERWKCGAAPDIEQAHLLASTAVSLVEPSLVVRRLPLKLLDPCGGRIRRSAERRDAEGNGAAEKSSDHVDDRRVLLPLLFAKLVA